MQNKQPKPKPSRGRKHEMWILMAVDVLRYIMNFFYGPFLTLYFFKTSADSVVPLSIYDMIGYGILGVVPVVLGVVIKERYQMTTLRLGVVMNFVYVLYILIAGEAIVENLGVLALLFGVSTALYYYPHNIVSGRVVDKRHRDNYELTKKVLISVAGIAVPFLMGLTITETNFQVAAGGVLVLSLIQIVLTFFLKPARQKPRQFRLFRATGVFMRDKNVRSQLLTSLLCGMTTSDSAMQALLPILIFSSFQTDLDFGVISSVTNMLLILVSFLYLKTRRWRGNKWVLTSFAVIPLVGLMAYLGMANDMTLVLYYVCYTLMIGLIQLIATIKVYNVSQLPVVKRGRAREYWALREVMHGLGRVASYVLMLLAGLAGGWWMYGLLVVLTLMLMPVVKTVRKIKA